MNARNISRESVARLKFVIRRVRRMRYVEIRCVCVLRDSQVLHVMSSFVLADVVMGTVSIETAYVVNIGLERNVLRVHVIIEEHGYLRRVDASVKIRSKVCIVKIPRVA